MVIEKTTRILLQAIRQFAEKAEQPLSAIQIMVSENEGQVVYQKCIDYQPQSEVVSKDFISNLLDRMLFDEYGTPFMLKSIIAFADQQETVPHDIAAIIFFDEKSETLNISVNTMDGTFKKQLSLTQHFENMGIN